MRLLLLLNVLFLGSLAAQTGVTITISNIPSSATRVMAMVDGAAVAGTIYTEQLVLPPGASSATVGLGLPPGTYRVRALADTGSYGQLLRSGQTTTTVPSAGNSTAIVALADLSVVLDPSTPTSAGAATTVTFRFNINDPGDVLEFASAGLRWGTAPFSITSGGSGLASGTLTRLGVGNYYVTMNARMPSTGSVLYYAVAIAASPSYSYLYSPDPRVSPNSPWQMAIITTSNEAPPQTDEMYFRRV